MRIGHENGKHCSIARILHSTRPRYDGPLIASPKKLCLVEGDSDDVCESGKAPCDLLIRLEERPCRFHHVRGNFDTSYKASQRNYQRKYPSPYPDAGTTPCKQNPESQDDHHRSRRYYSKSDSPSSRTVCNRLGLAGRWSLWFVYWTEGGPRKALSGE